MDKELNELLAELVELYTQEQSICQEILRISQKLKQATIEGTKLDSLLSKRAEELERINELESKIDQLKELIAGKLDLTVDKELIPELLQLDIPYQFQLQEVITENIKLVHQIQELDEKIKEELAIRQREIKSELLKLKQGSNLNNSYHQQPSYNEGKFIDEKN
ncbi:hypothetical protein [Sporohalobacter salinus]|uniref:hypothetical protein n=1 Tax=Sporohalobacter salinus TaxID=1494606 RepID=UPI0019610A35|nr:hypothetical protein [Sporohalobacter salinus]MBM7623037.1 ribosomal protein L29 [Sporohalobacter salinus]